MNGEQKSFAHELARAKAIARLNDKLREEGRGGRLLVTQGVMNLAGYNTGHLLKGLAVYDAFDADNDPHGERDFGDLHAFKTDLLWKIDYYDLNLEFASPDPANPDVTIRVLTVMLADEY